MTNELNKYFKSVPVEIRRSEIKLANYNPRKISDEALRKLKQNIKKVGLLGGIIWNETTGNLVSGHQRVTILDQLNKYDNSPESDYVLRVERVALSEKEEKEQNIFMNNPSVQGEFDMDIMRDLLPEIDYTFAGLSEQDLAMIGIDFDDAGADSIADDFDDLLQPHKDAKQAEKADKKELSQAERKAHNKAVKAQVRKESEDKAMNMESYVVLNFDTFKSKSAFMRRFGFSIDEKYIDGDMFSEMVERIE